MPALDLREGTRDAFPRRRRGGRSSLTAPVALVSLAIALLMMLGSPRPSSADNGPNNVDVDPDTASLVTGQLVSLTAVLTPGSDVASSGQVSFFILPGSPNDTVAAPDFTCDGSAGTCTVSYVATNAGVDVICATTRSIADGCSEAWETNDATSTDVVQRVISAATPTTTGWTLTVNPSSVAQGTTTDFVARVTHTSSGGNIGCSIIDVAPAFTVLEVQLVGTSSGATWGSTASGNRVQIQADSGGGKLSVGDWVDVRIRATASQAGLHGWSGTASSSTGCTSEPSYLNGQTAWVSVVPVTPTPTPVPTPVPTPIPTPVPTPVATPTPAPTAKPAPAVVPRPPKPPAPVTATPEPTPTPTPAPEATPALEIPPVDRGSEGPAAPTEPPTAAPSRVERPPDRVDVPGPGGPVVAAPVGPTAPATENPLGQILGAAADGFGRVVSPEAAAQVARTFGFPLALMMAVLLFLIVQDRVDRRDPKLQAAPRTFLDTIVRFKEEEDL